MITYDTQQALKLAIENLKDSLKVSNELWYGAIKLIVTLSSSFLLLTFAFLDKISSPNIKSFADISVFLIIPWGFLSLSIILGIIAQLDSAIFFLNMGKSSGNLIKKCLFDLQQGNPEGKIEIPYQLIGFDKKIWGALAIDFYIIAIFCLCLVFLEKVVGDGICWIILLIILFFLGLLNCYLIKKYKEIPTT